jgi:hypothetical protein
MKITYGITLLNKMENKAGMWHQFWRDLLKRLFIYNFRSVYYIKAKRTREFEFIYLYFPSKRPIVLNKQAMLHYSIIELQIFYSKRFHFIIWMIFINTCLNIYLKFNEIL